MAAVAARERGEEGRKGRRSLDLREGELGSTVEVEMAAIGLRVEAVRMEEIRRRTALLLGTVAIAIDIEQGEERAAVDYLGMGV